MSVCSASSAMVSKRRRISSSSSGEASGSPSGCGIATPGMMRLAPTVNEIGTMEQTWAVGRPTRSSSLTIVAPQRVQVPQVDVRMTACTPTLIRVAAISSPKRFARATAVALPTVAK